MTTQEIIKKVKQIELKSLKKTNSVFLGEYHSSFKGRGMIFSEVRPYQYGDDVRKMDWNKTAQYHIPFVKIFEEERELTLMLLVDISASMNFGTQKQLKKETVAEICATLGFSANKNNDKVGLLLFSDKVNLFIPPKKGKSHILRIIREVLEFKIQKATSNLNLVLDYFLNTVKRKSIAFLISDFETEDFAKKMLIASRKHDITGIRIHDNLEDKFPNIGLVKVQDSETGQTKWVDTSSPIVRSNYQKYYKELEENLQTTFLNSGAGFINLKTQDDYYKALLNYFQRQHSR